MKKLKLFEEWYGEDPDHMINMVIDTLSDLEQYYQERHDEGENAWLEIEEEDYDIDNEEEFFNRLSKAESKYQAHGDNRWLIHSMIEKLKKMKEELLQELKEDSKKYNL